MSKTDNHNYNQIGKDIENAFKEGLSTGNWGKLNATIANSVDTVIDDARSKVIDSTNGNAKNLSTHQEAYSSGAYTRQRQQQLYEERRRRDEQRQKDRHLQEEALAKRRANRASTINKNANTQITVPMNKIGGVSSIVYTVAGSVGLGVTGVSVLSSLPALILGTASTTGLVTGGVIALLFAAILRTGIVQSKRLSLAKRYAVLSGNKDYVEIESLARSVGKAPKAVVREIKKLLKLGFFPQGHLDDENSNLIFTDATYNQYLETKKNANKAIIDTTAREVGGDACLNADEESELDQMIREGKDYIIKLHELNDKIPGEVITNKLSRLEELLEEIFRCLKQHPEQMGKMHELMEYYLPTMIKLVTAYEEYDKVSAPGKEIEDAKKDIEDTLDTINVAFKKLLNNLFKDSVWDVTTDAQVLKTLLAQKGLSSGMEESSNE